jgi:chaperonin GroEL
MGNYVRSVVNIAMHGDARAEKIGTLVHEVGAGGSIELDQSKTGEFYTEKTNGYSWEGMVVPDPSFFTTPKAAVYENALVAVVSDKLATVEEVKSIFDAYQLKCSVRDSNNKVEAVIPQPLVLVFNDLSGDALRVFQLRRHRESGQPLPYVVVCAPGDSEMERLQYMKDIAAFSGATYFNKRDGKNMKAFSASDFGRVKKVVANLSTCVLTEQETPLSVSMKKEMVALLENTIKSEKNETVKAFWQKRLNKLMSKVGTIFIAPKTEGEYLYDSELCEDAYRAGMAAMEEGVIPGCGVTLLHFSEAKHTYYAYAEGYAAAKQAMEAPFSHILSNAGASLDTITSGIAFFSDKFVDMMKTFDAETFDEVNAIEAGILDTKRGVTAALRNAWSECQKIANSKFIIING